MKLYAGIDLRANNNYLAIIAESDTRVYKNKLPTKPDVILAELEPFKKEISGIVVESTFNWYWLVDFLRLDSTPRIVARYRANDK